MFQTSCSVRIQSLGATGSASVRAVTTQSTGKAQYCPANQLRRGGTRVCCVCHWLCQCRCPWWRGEHWQSQWHTCAIAEFRKKLPDRIGQSQWHTFGCGQRAALWRSFGRQGSLRMTVHSQRPAAQQHYDHRTISVPVAENCTVV